MLKRTISTFSILLLMCTSLLAISLTSTNVGAIQVIPADMALVYVDPPHVSVSQGETFTVSVKVFNLSDNFYTTDQIWEPGDPLPPPGTAYNYSLGHILGFDIRLSWDPAILNYEEHVVTTPVEDYPDGILHGPVFSLRDEVNETAGTYMLVQTTLGQSIFNRPDANSNVFNMTFTVMTPGITTLNITHSDLAAPTMAPGFEGIQMRVPHWVQNGRFEQVWNLADINNDLKVDIYDIVWICLVYGSTPSDPEWYARCDIAAPYGIIDINDLVSAALNYGEEYTP